MNRESREIIKIAKELIAKTPYDKMSENERKRALDQMGKHIPLMEGEARAFMRYVNSVFPESKLKMSSGFSHNNAQVYPYVKVDVHPEQSRPFFELFAYHDTRRKYDFDSEIELENFLGYRMNLRLGGSPTPEGFRSVIIKPLIHDAITWLNKADNQSELLMKTLGIDPHFRPDATKPSIVEIKAIIEKESWLDMDYERKDELSYSTRRHGDVGSESPGMEDINMVKRVRKSLLDKFGSNNLLVDSGTTDEWAYLTVKIK